jgi:hypothetical protein
MAFFSILSSCLTFVPFVNESEIGVDAKECVRMRQFLVPEQKTWM